MIETLIFSRDRACQLDLLLRSIDSFAVGIAPVHVLYHATNNDFEHGYGIAQKYHPWVKFHREEDFASDVHRIISGIKLNYMMCLTDDSFFRREFLDPMGVIHLVAKKEDILCFSLRLGENTTVCYPHRRDQEMPVFISFKNLDFSDDATLLWTWARADGDFGYPGSLDGHVFTTERFRACINGRDFTNPNQLEDALVAGCREASQPLMACFSESLLVGVPANRVNETHPNRAEQGTLHVRLLNDMFIKGKRLDLEALVAKEVNGAHTGLPLEFA